MFTPPKYVWTVLFLLLFPLLQGCGQRTYQESHEKPLPDGRIEVTVDTRGQDDKTLELQEKFIGRKNVNGHWEGEVESYTFEKYANGFVLDSKETYRNGIRHGKSTYFDLNQSVYRTVCYNNGILVKCDSNSSFAEYDILFNTADSGANSSYPTTAKLLDSRKPWLIHKLSNFGFPSEFLLDYTAEVEYLLKTISDQDNYDYSFSSAASSIGSSDPYKKFYGAYSSIVGASGDEALKDNPLRLAVLKRYRTNASSTYAVLQASYSRGLLALRTLGAKPADTQFYTNQVDSYLNKINSALGAIPAQDPLYPSKVDQRLDTALAILDDKGVAAGGFISAKTNLGLYYHNAGNPLLDAARYGYFGQTLPLSLKTTGAGSVTGEGLDCGLSTSNCREYYDVGSTVTLTARPQSGAKFAGWGGDCAGTAPSCTLKISQERLVLANFTGGASPFYLSVRPSGVGQVTTNPSGIYCSGPGGTCAMEFAPGTPVTLTASPFSDAQFVSWGGSCTGTATTCQLTMNSDKTVAATFRTITPSYPLALFRTGPGDIRATAGGYQYLDCGKDCTGIFPVGRLITLQAVPRTDAKLVKWSGACQGTAATCDITIKGETFVGATFATE